MRSRAADHSADSAAVTGRNEGPHPTLGTPAALEARTFDVGPDEYVVFSFPLPRWRLPTGLTPAERQIATMILRGNKLDVVARSRGRSLNTVRNQWRTILRKLGVTSEAELMLVLEREAGDGW